MCLNCMFASDMFYRVAHIRYDMLILKSNHLVYNWYMAKFLVIEKYLIRELILKGLVVAGSIGWKSTFSTHMLARPRTWSCGLLEWKGWVEHRHPNWMITNHEAEGLSVRSSARCVIGATALPPPIHFHSSRAFEHNCRAPAEDLAMWIWWLLNSCWCQRS